MKRIPRHILFRLTALLSLGASALAAETPAPHPPLPGPAQLAWHKAELLMFVHFGMKTFYPSNDHMGYGKEDPARFNPVKFDPAQWVAAAKAGGFKGIVLTTKHHDGFCNWRTDTTKHSVKSAPWRDGKGDVVRELAEACRAGGIKFGVYVSIIDKHFEGAKDPAWANYGDYYLAQIKELSTRYGVIDEYWFDGFNADQLKMDYAAIAEVIRTHQPGAVVYDSGTLVKYLPDRSLAWPNAHGGVRPDQDYRQTVDGRRIWYPNEASLILQGNWFHNGKPAVPLRQMQEYYLRTVGFGTTPLMNVAPNRDGLVDEATIAALKEFKAWVDALQANDLARAPGVAIQTTPSSGGAEKMNDGDRATFWAAPADTLKPVIEIDLGGSREISGFLLQEPVELGQRVKGYALDGRVNGEWKEITAGVRIGYQRIHLEGRGVDEEKVFPAADAVRLRILDAEASPVISTFQIIGPLQP